MAKKKKHISKRTNKWSKIKSALWRERKEQGLYSWNSENFNKLVSEVYVRSGKNPNIRGLSILAEQIEQELYTNVKQETYQVAYFDIGRILDSFKEDPRYLGYVVETNFNGEYKDVKFHVEDFNYDGSFFQEIVKQADAERKKTGQSYTPNQNLKIKIDPLLKKILVSVKSPSGRSAKQKPFKNIKTPEKIIYSTNRIKEIDEELINTRKQINNNSELIIFSIKSNLPNDEKSELVRVFANEVNIFRKQEKQLLNEKKEIEKFLSDTGGFKESKSTRKGNSKRSTKKREQSTNYKRKRK